jgi:tetratricopeptide (TPR) repeat protein
MGTQPADFFISYQKRDLAWARWIDSALRDEGFTTIFQARDFKVGDNFVKEMDRAFKQSRRTIAVLSEHYLRSFWTLHECSTALARSKDGGAFIPVRVRPVADLGILAPIAYVDLVGKPKPAARKVLIAGLRGAQALSGPVRFPGARETVSVLPFARNPFFVGREALLEALRGDAAPVATDVVALTGLGGVGKTQIAVEFAHRHLAGGGSVLWVRADDPLNLRAGFTSVARRLSLPVPPDADAPLEDIVAPLVSWLAARPGWLLVFDNVDAETTALVRTCIPSCGGGRVLVTTRLSNVASLGVAKPTRVDEFTPDDGLAFVQRRAQRDTLTASERAAAARLVHELGGLPLALEQAAAYITASGATFHAYLSSFERQRLKLLEAGLPEATGYSATVGTTWRINLDRIATESPAAADLLRVSAFLAPEAIPLSLIVGAARSERFSLAGFFEQIVLDPRDHRHSTVLGGQLKQALADADRDPMVVYALIEPLLRYSLIRLDASREAYTVHRVLQDVVRQAMTADDRELWIRRALEMTDAAFPASQQFTRATEPLHPHARAVIAHARVACPSDHCLRSLMVTFGADLLLRSAYAEARPMLEEAAARIEAIDGETSRSLIVALHNLGRLYTEVGDYPRAAHTLQRAMELGEKKAIEPVSLAMIQDMLGNVLVRQNRPADAEPLHRRALATFEAECGPNDVRVATSCQFLGMALATLGQWDEHRALCHRTLEIYRRVLPPNSPEIATALHNLAGATPDPQRALQYLNEARAICEATLGPESVPGARSAVLAAHLRLAIGDTVGVEPLLTDAIRVLERALGEQHLELASALTALAQAYHREGRLPEVYTALERAYRIYAAQWGPHCRDAVNLLAAMVNNLQRRGEHSQGLAYTDALLAAIDATQPGSSNHGAVWNLRGSFLYEMRRYAEAKEAHAASLAIQERLHGAEAGDVAVTLNNLANACSSCGSFEEAEGHYRRALDLFEQHAPSHPMRAQCVSNFAITLEKAGRSDEAQRLRAANAAQAGTSGGG